MTRLPKKPRVAKKAPKKRVRHDSPPSRAYVPQPEPYRPTYAFAGGCYWCTQVGLFPVIEPYINGGGVNGYGFGIRVAWFGGNAYAEWWKP